MGANMDSSKKQKANKISKVAVFLKIYIFPRHLMICYLVHNIKANFDPKKLPLQLTLAMLYTSSGGYTTTDTNTILICAC